MNIAIITPGTADSRSGNRVTALRWAKLLHELGHRVRITNRLDHRARITQRLDQRGRIDQPLDRRGRKTTSGDRAGRNVRVSDRRACDLLIALHAKKSHAAIKHFAETHPDRPIVVALTGTDVYGTLKADRRAKESLELADRLIVLQPKAIARIPKSQRHKVCVIRQSVAPMRSSPNPRPGRFEVCVIGHLRRVKDPFRTAMAVRRLPASSAIRVTHVGRALSEAMTERAMREQDRNPRYRWVGEWPRWRVLRLLSRSRLMVLSSIAEGGANVVSEAIVAGVPVISSRIDGSIGLLGEDYAGYFPVGDTAALRELLVRAEDDGRYYARLKRHCGRLAPAFTPARERRAWSELLRSLDHTMDYRRER